jgi:hypothetical protein
MGKKNSEIRQGMLPSLRLQSLPKARVMNSTVMSLASERALMLVPLKPH